MKIERKSGRVFDIDGDRFVTVSTRMGTLFKEKFSKYFLTKQPPATNKYSKGIERQAKYLIRGFHDWFYPKYHLHSGFDSKTLYIHYVQLRDDWEDHAKRAFDAWGELGFEFKVAKLPETANIFIDDEDLSGAYAYPVKLMWAGKYEDGKPVVYKTHSRVNISKRWPEWGVYHALVHEQGHCLGLGHPGPYNGDIIPQVSEYDHTDYTCMSYHGPQNGKIGDVDRCAIDMRYE